MPKTMEKNLFDRRNVWLKKQKSPLKGRLDGMTKREFAESLEIDYNTAVRWFEKSDTRTPRGLYLDRVLSKFPDFPL